ncbi:MAG: cyclic nucleotide-binding domain-containing protein [Actinobacteria bacterium]|nr:cyclic nucleotide-binding domain-containing protein [Actinomycetota bacterium]
MAREDPLAIVPLFSALSRRELKRVAQVAKEVSFDAGDVIAEAGEEGLAFYVITSGEADVRRGNTKVAALIPGDFFGEISLLDGGPRTATVVAATPLKCLSILRWDFRKLLEKDPSLVPKILKELSRRLRQIERSVTA